MRHGVRHLGNISIARVPPVRTPEAVPNEACAFPPKHTHLCANNRLERNEERTGIQDRWKEDGTWQHLGSGPAFIRHTHVTQLGSWNNELSHDANNPLLDFIINTLKSCNRKDNGRYLIPAAGMNCGLQCTFPICLICHWPVEIFFKNLCHKEGKF